MARIGIILPGKKLRPWLPSPSRMDTELPDFCLVRVLHTSVAFGTLEVTSGARGLPGWYVNPRNVLIIDEENAS